MGWPPRFLLARDEVDLAGNRPYWMAQVAMSPRVKNSALSIMVWSTQPVLGVLLLAVVGPTAGRYYIDISSGVPPKQFIRGEWFVGIALLTGVVWALCAWAGLSGSYLGQEGLAWRRV